MTAAGTTTATVPWCVDLDGTLIATDTLFELALTFLRHYPHRAWQLPLWFMRGRAYLKQQLAHAVPLAVAHLPYRPAVLARLRQLAPEHQLYLVTAADRYVARQVAEHLGMFSGVLASDGITNLSGRRKAARLRQEFGDRGYNYMGNAWSDVAVWRHAAAGIVVSRRQRLAARARHILADTTVLAPDGSPAHAWRRALRVHQWVKNILLFVPVVAAHQLNDLASLAAVSVAFISFSLAASGAYIANDLLDLAADRQHPQKRHRPWAAGQLPLPIGVLAVPVLLAASIGLSLLLPRDFLGLLLGYVGLTFAYSLYVKRIPIVDVVLLAILYTLRIFAGAAAAEITVSTWLTAFALFLFLSLAQAKRFSELLRLAGEAAVRAAGRGYQTSDRHLLSQFGVVSGYLSLLVLALYISSDEVTPLYRHPTYLWGVVPLLTYWISRLWLLVHRGVITDDPLLFALRDYSSYVVAVATGLIVYLAV